MEPIVIQNRFSYLACKAMFNMSLFIIWPLILVKDGKTGMTTLNKSKIKCEQLTELLVFGRFIIYLWDYVEGLTKYRSFKRAHNRVRFEQEMSHYENNMTYLSFRPIFGWVDYQV